MNLKSEFHMHAYIFDKIDPNRIVVEHLLEQDQLCRIDVRLARIDFKNVCKSGTVALQPFDYKFAVTVMLVTSLCW